ncbi:hypothetical protein GJ496_003596 [Pomphorhynchus laevis]|nr:hypothetical protein GJ496_003596 [Pomphorhynchus laevis]
MSSDKELSDSCHSEDDQDFFTEESDDDVSTDSIVREDSDDNDSDSSSVSEEEKDSKNLWNCFVNEIVKLDSKDKPHSISSECGKLEDKYDIAATNELLSDNTDQEKYLPKVADQERHFSEDTDQQRHSLENMEQDKHLAEYTNKEKCFSEDTTPESHLDSDQIKHSLDDRINQDKPHYDISMLKAKSDNYSSVNDSGSNDETGSTRMDQAQCKNERNLDTSGRPQKNVQSNHGVCTKGRKRLSDLSSTLDALNKKTKPTILDNSKSSWKEFKKSAQIEEELSAHVKGKDSYLSKKEFLERAEQRTFEKERKQRTSRKK